MGTSFSNVQIKTKDIDLVKEALIKLHKDKKEDNLFVMGKQKYYIGKSEEWITLLNAMYDGCYYDFAILLSRYMSVPLFVIEIFDESHMEICFIQNGETIIKHITGEEEELEIEEDENEDFFPEASSQLGDVGKIIKSFNLSIKEDELTDILKLDDIEDKISSLEELFAINLWVKAEWIEDDEELRSNFKSISIE